MTARELLVQFETVGELLMSAQGTALRDALADLLAHEARLVAEERRDAQDGRRMLPSDIKSQQDCFDDGREAGVVFCRALLTDSRRFEERVAQLKDEAQD